MIRSTSLPAAFALAALSLAAGSALAEVHKCQGPHGTTYSDGPCPASQAAVTYTPRDLLKAEPTGAGPTSPASTRPGPPSVAARAPAATAVAAAGPVPDAPLPVVETGVATIEQVPGRLAWLDADTLAVTTYTEPRAKVAWIARRVVAVDTRSHAVATLVPKGFLDCSNPDTGLVGVQVGDLESAFGVHADAPKPVHQFLAWNPASHAVAPAPADLAAGVHAASCLRTRPEDVAANDWWEGSRALRYLGPKDGVIRWGMGDSGRPEGPSLQNGSRKTMLDVTTSEMARQVRPLPFRKAYQLAPGQHQGAAGAPKDAPLITMTPDGRVTRTALPASLKQLLDTVNPDAIATSYAVKPGALVVVPGAPAQGGGLYLATASEARRVWCTAGAGADAAACRLAFAPEVSPDGCKVAFDGRGPGGPATVKVLDVCAGAPAAASGKATVARR